jgi:hypothetical protein
MGITTYYSQTVSNNKNPAREAYIGSGEHYLVGPLCGVSRGGYPTQGAGERRTI